MNQKKFIYLHDLFIASYPNKIIRTNTLLGFQEIISVHLLEHNESLYKVSLESSVGDIVGNRIKFNYLYGLYEKTRTVNSSQFNL